MKKYSVKMATINWEYSYHEVEADGLKDLISKCKDLLILNPGKVLVDYELKGFYL